MTAPAALAADCPGHPDALGTSRTLVVDPREHPRIGTMQYAETLPLADREVVLTFDDGPLPKYSNRILEILASHCVKATFFLVGSQARANPEGVRKVRDAGHTVATHTQNHPTGMHHLPTERVQQEIDEGHCVGDRGAGRRHRAGPVLSRAGPRTLRSDRGTCLYHGAQVWSADFPADDWRHVSSSRVYELAMQRLEAKGKGILLLHDIQARTVAALPKILQEMKARGYRIVHVVPATAELPATPTEPQQWRRHPPSENVATSHWPKIPNFVFAERAMLPGPWLSDSYWNDEWLARRAAAHRRRSAAAQAPWPRQMPLPLLSAVNALPVPGQSVFEFRDGCGWSPDCRRAAALFEPAHARHGAGSGAAGSRRLSADAAGKPQVGRVKPASASHAAGHAGRHAAQPGPANAEAFGPGQETKRLTAQFVTILATHSSTTMARKNRSM